MKTLQKLLALLLALVLVLGLCACAKDETSTDAPATGNTGSDTTTPSGDEGTGEDEAADRSLIIGTTIAPATFLSSTGSVNSYTNMLFDSLMMYNDKGEIVPALATEWEYTDDYTLKLTLRDDVYFTEGQKLVASDVIYSLTFWATETYRSETLSILELGECKAEGDNVVILKFKEVYGPALPVLSNLVIFCEEWALQATGDDWYTKPNGTGAYICTENVDGSHTSFVRKEADQYWGELPECEAVTYKYYGETSTMYIDLEQGAIDMAYNINNMDAERLINGTEENKSLAYQLQGMNVNISVGLCEYCPLWEDARVREAVALALDYDAIATAALGVLWQPATSLLPNAVNYHVDQPRYEKNIERAKELMAEAGCADGFEVRAIVNLDSTDLATAVQACLAEIGIVLNVESYDLGTMLPMWIGGETEIMMDVGGESNGSGDPTDSITINHEGSTLAAARIIDEEFNSYYYEALYSIDDAVRAEGYAKLQQWNYENIRIIPICEATRCTAWNSEKIESVLFTNPGRPIVTYVTFAD